MLMKIQKVLYFQSSLLSCVSFLHLWLVSRAPCREVSVLWNIILTSVRLSLGLPGGLARSTHSSSSSDIKREDKEDDENSSVADKSDDEKKESKARSRTR